MPEYKVITSADAPEVQKLLNQWRHQYDLRLHGTTISADGKVSVIVERSEKK